MISDSWHCLWFGQGHNSCTPPQLEEKKKAFAKQTFSLNKPSSFIAKEVQQQGNAKTHKEVFTHTVESSLKSPIVSPPIPSLSGICKVRKFY
jgi:hypothetical protein